MKLSEKNYSILLIELNKIIEDIAETTAKNIAEGSINKEIAYPPNNGFYENELNTLEEIKSVPAIETALRKVIANSIACAIFDFLNLIDGTGDPEIAEWSGDGICLVDLDDSFEESIDMLHDGLFEKYWEWRKQRNKDWKLDIFDD